VGVGRVRLVAVSVAAAALAAPATASAHATLLRTVPAAGAVLTHAPSAVRVVFDDTVAVGSGNAAVANGSRASVQDGPPQAHGHVLVIPLRPHLRDGDYSVRWSIVSDDGHRERGVLAFAVGRGRAPPASVLTAAVPLGISDVVFRSLFYLGLLTAAGTAAFGLLVRRFAPLLETRLAHLLFFSLLVAFVGCSGLVRDATASTRYGLVLDVALGVAALGAAAAALAPRVRPLRLPAAACSLLLIAAPTLSGHALDDDQPWALSIAADLVHVAAAAVWLGGLASLLVVLTRADLTPDDRDAILRRFSRAALRAVAALAASGLLRAVTELRAVDQLWTTTYGRALLVKAGLLLPLLGLGYLNRSRLLGGYAGLRRSVRAELVLLVAVVATVSVLVQLRPGRAAPPGRYSGVAGPLDPSPPSR